MALHPRFLPELPPAFPPPPDWARAAGKGGNRQGNLGEAMFAAGAALGALHPLARGDHPLASLWRQRLALSSACAVVRLQGRSEDAAALRDHLYLTRPGDDPGPAGRVLQAWRALAAGAPLPDLLLPGPFLPDMDGAMREAFDDAAASAAGRENPLDAAAGIAETALGLRPDARPLALWLADAVLARRLNWPTPVPLLAAHLGREAFRHAGHHAGGRQADPAAWRLACARAYGDGAAVASDLYADLARRAERLLAVAPRLRGKDAGETVTRLLSEDALAAGPGKAASDRSMRRLFERLVSLGAVRELTGRPTFRLYGL